VELIIRKCLDFSLVGKNENKEVAVKRNKLKSIIITDSIQKLEYFDQLIHCCLDSKGLQEFNTIDKLISFEKYIVKYKIKVEAGKCSAGEMRFMILLVLFKLNIVT